MFLFYIYFYIAHIGPLKQIIGGNKAITPQDTLCHRSVAPSGHTPSESPPSSPQKYVINSYPTKMAAVYQKSCSLENARATVCIAL